MDKLKESGLEYLTLGVESFSDVVLKKMGKSGIDSKKIIRTIKILCSRDISVRIGLIAGFPGETKKIFLNTWKKVLDLKARYKRKLDVAVHPFQLRPDSDCYRKRSSYGVSIEPWDEKTVSILPKLKDIIKKTPMCFTSQLPGNSETLRRLNTLEIIDEITKDEPFNEQKQSL